MKMFKLIIIPLLSIALFSSCSKELQNEKQYVVMLSLDGFRWDYPDNIPTPNLDYIAEIGVKAKSLKPCFPTKTFPNHYSMATGLYPDHHGIVLNSFYDEDMNAYYRIKDRDAVENADFYDGEPIWVTAEKQGVISASYFWVGSEAPIKDKHPTYWKRYKHNYPFEARLDT
ncbi:MAG: ectonucleotide pyrophosphatase/phosphodiesterase, partial [Bacteroidales bacterium]|nr:ectonucleotide pyrophosphatase/phosphodiesterase [Bacteroidales bacterium]